MKRGGRKEEKTKEEGRGKKQVKRKKEEEGVIN